MTVIYIQRDICIFGDFFLFVLHEPKNSVCAFLSNVQRYVHCTTTLYCIQMQHIQDIGITNFHDLRMIDACKYSSTGIHV